MGYILKAYIGRKENLIPILGKYRKSKLVELTKGLAIIPMTAELFDEINEMKISPGVSNFEFLTENVEFQTLRTIEYRELAYVESEFFGSQGGHIGIIWRNRKRDFVSGFDKNAMNEILKRLGIKRIAQKDEFETVGLAEYRKTEDWINKKN